ncbi:SCO family protein [Ruegeria pomeroyi]|uniref:SCO family protein n=1 Tax=Ruegeria pomeroyi TaxID=89184 RepID=A0A9Q3WJY0_9RHOB|nr:SCO family protein [Ruegeria pomeroyi]MCE8537228.1 SCO family protein [Ruegeria pomeroyi]
MRGLLGFTLLMGAVLAAPAQAGNAPLPFDVGGPFELTDQNGARRSQADPQGHGQLLFFGYATCPGICSAAMPMMADAVDRLADAGIPVTPVMITVDPERDRPGEMNAPLARYHRDFIGLTGSEAELQAAYDAYSVERELAYVDPEYGPVYTHGAFVYLLDAKGEVLSLFPPILSSDRVVELARKYLGSEGS